MHVYHSYLQFEELFKPYTKFCLEKGPCLEYMKSRYRDDELFKSFVGVSMDFENL